MIAQDVLDERAPRLVSSRPEQQELVNAGKCRLISLPCSRRYDAVNVLLYVCPGGGRLPEVLRQPFSDQSVNEGR